MSTVPGAHDRDDEPVGVVLARMRQSRRMTGAQLAAVVGMSQPKISRIERGRGSLDPADVEVIARALGADEVMVQALMSRAERSLDRMTDWRMASLDLAGSQMTLVEWEAAATSVRAFEPAVVPGLLQTSGYARQILQAFFRLVPLAPAHTVEQALMSAVSGRVRRQEVLADPEKSFHFILGEGALRRRAHTAVEMLAQISHLRALGEQRTNVNIAVVPDAAPVEVPLQNGFFLYDDELVVVELYNTALFSRSRRDVEINRRVFDQAAEHAVDLGPMLDHYEQMYIDLLQRPTR
ncbi:helix-turn-helix transcriptional regulator [Actinoplanes sp. NPDC049596]|uniref:helix-turn-helix domain-containing protein n=1 Tax=unclassified Actinoplanes TaxID=2626549 RepID=UPI00342F291B